MSISALVALAGLAALVMAMVNWTRRHCDRRALIGVATITFVLMAVTYANSWPSLAMALDTTEPVASQIGLSAAGMLLGAAVAALLFGLLAGVGAWATQRQPPHAFAGQPPGVAAGRRGGAGRGRRRRGARQLSRPPRCRGGRPIRSKRLRCPRSAPR